MIPHSSSFEVNLDSSDIGRNIHSEISSPYLSVINDSVQITAESDLDDDVSTTLIESSPSDDFSGVETLNSQILAMEVIKSSNLHLQIYAMLL